MRSAVVDEPATVRAQEAKDAGELLERFLAGDMIGVMNVGDRLSPDERTGALGLVINALYVALEHASGAAAQDLARAGLRATIRWSGAPQGEDP